jgi:hypothetical protein
MGQSSFPESSEGAAARLRRNPRITEYNKPRPKSGGFAQPPGGRQGGAAEGAHHVPGAGHLVPQPEREEFQQPHQAPHLPKRQGQEHRAGHEGQDDHGQQNRDVDLNGHGNFPPRS